MTNKQLINDLQNLKINMFTVAHGMINNHKNKEVQEKGEELMNASKMVHEWIDINEEALFYCLHNAEMIVKDIVYNEKRDYNRAIKSLKKMFKDFKIINNGEDYTCSTRFIMPLENK